MGSSAPSRPRLVALACLAAAATIAPAGAAVAGPVTVDRADARALLEVAVAALDQPHVGRVSVVTFGEAGPRVAELDVRVGAMGAIELRRPTRWLLGGPGTGWLRTVEGARAVTPAATGLGLDVDTILTHWAATTGATSVLDTGPATPVHLVRRTGAAVQEVVHVDHGTGLPVRRETRAADGRVLRVVAYTALSEVALPAVSPVAVAVADPPAATDLEEAATAGFDVPWALGAGFELRGIAHHEDMVTARYGDGLSVLSVYQQHGRLDAEALDGAVVRTVAGRDVWSWPGSEPLRLVWTGDDRTWTVVSDAPLAVIEDALVSLPGDHVGHDVPSRIVRGMSRAWSWLRTAVTG